MKDERLVVKIFVLGIIVISCLTFLHGRIIDTHPVNVYLIFLLIVAAYYSLNRIIWKHKN